MLSKLENETNPWVDSKVGTKEKPYVYWGAIFFILRVQKKIDPSAYETLPHNASNTSNPNPKYICVLLSIREFFLQVRQRGIRLSNPKIMRAKKGWK